MKLSDRIELFTCRLSGTFDLTPEEGESLEHDEEITLVVRGRVKQAVLGVTRSGSVQLCYVVAPSEAHLGLAQDDWEDTGRDRSPLVPDDDPIDLSGRSFDPDEFGDTQVEWGDANSEPQPTDGPEYHQDHASWEDARRKKEEFREEEIFSPGKTNVRPSTVSPNSNVAGSSQVERDRVLARFIEEGR